MPKYIQYFQMTQKDKIEHGYCLSDLTLKEQNSAQKEIKYLLM